MKKLSEKLSLNLRSVVILWIAAFVLGIALLFARAVYPEFLWLTILLGLLLIGALVALVSANRKALRGRTVAYGLNSVTTVLLVLGILGVVNFLVLRYPQKLDLTENRVHTLSEQTKKLVRGMKTEVRATVFAKIQQREAVRPMLERYKALSPKFVVEYVDPDKEPTRARQAEIKKYGTVLLEAAGRQSKVEEATEEKLTNALIKLIQEKTPTLCAVTGHGEKSFASEEADGYAAAKRALGLQAYEVTDIDLKEGKIADTCTAIAIMGPTKAYFESEVKAIREYLERGGRAVIAFDVDLRGGGEYAPELIPVVQSWYVRPVNALIVDPFTRLLTGDPAVPLLASFSKENPITSDLRESASFPFSRPLEVIGGAPADLSVQWLAQTTPQSWGVTDLSSIQKGAISFKAGQDKKGPLTAAIAVEGKLPESQAAQKTRLVVFGTSAFAANNFSRFGSNLDLFLNAVSWVMEDETMISIRPKESASGRVELTAKQGNAIFLLTFLLPPVVFLAAGIVVWVRRRRM